MAGRLTRKHKGFRRSGTRKNVLFTLPDRGQGHAAVVLFTGFLGIVTLLFRSTGWNVKLETDTLLTPAPHWLP